MAMFYLNVPFAEKDQAKALGAKWDWDEKRWYYMNADDEKKFTRWLPIEKKVAKLPELSDEQKKLIELVGEGKNVLVDACIGSGKTTTIQVMCTKFSQKSILYLTYNTLLKIDAQDKINCKNVFVQNYHGYARACLQKAGFKNLSVPELIQNFNKEKPALVRPVDLLVIDEYQDIEEEISLMLQHIKDSNPNMQIVAVGDMAQKIYDKTTLDVATFIDGFLGEYTPLKFTKCFRLSRELASHLGDLWDKEINGVNPDCKISEMDVNDVVAYLAKKKPSDILCLGARLGDMAFVLNSLETEYPDKFNKKTVYASISDEDKGAVRPDSSTAIFTTYDGSKGLERPVCVVFDYTLAYWTSRTGKAMTKNDIVRNIFCVAASRGKREIIFARGKGEKLDDKTIKESVKSSYVSKIFDTFNMSDMFSFKYKEEVEKCFSLIDTTPLYNGRKDIININTTDELIDLSPCVGVYQEAMYFKNYDIDKTISVQQALDRGASRIRLGTDATIEEKILALTASTTKQVRYEAQVKPPFVTEEQTDLLTKRLSKVFKRNERVQVGCMIDFKQKLYTDPETHKDVNRECTISGICDVLKDGTVYELKFSDELKHENFLQLACYMIGLGVENGILWNTRNNDMYKVEIPDRKKFLDAVINCITKGEVSSYVPYSEDITKLRAYDIKEVTAEEVVKKAYKTAKKNRKSKTDKPEKAEKEKSSTKKKSSKKKGENSVA